MTPVAKNPNTTVKPHVHARWSVKDNVNGELRDEQMLTGKGPFSIENILDGITKLYAFTEYDKSYAFYKDGNTEYLRFEGTTVEDNLKLTCDVFSCYCEPLNENQEPPF
jgi:hypothetical protein